MKILMVSAEVFPFAKTGGLADAVASLSKALCAEGCEVKIVMPRYYRVDRRKLDLCCKSVCVSTGRQEVLVDFYKTNIDKSSVTVYFADYEKCFGREGIYGEGFEPDYRDNPFRFSLLARSALALCRNINWCPDIVQAHDWSSSMIPVILRIEKLNGRSFFSKTKSVLTIHNMGYQGRYPGGAFALTGLAEEYRQAMGFDQFGGINFLKAAITCADIITTVSPTYSDEIKTPALGFGLDGLLRVRTDSVFGILNGADADDWNPAVDKYLPANYSADDMTGKLKCRRKLQRDFNLPKNDEVPVIGMVSRLADQKGISEVFAPMYGCMYRMCRELNAQFVIVGSGENWCENEIRNLTKILPNLGSYIGYNEEKSRIVESGSDFFLMPSKYEPCGLNQIYSMLYGTVPIVRYTGGLADTVEPYEAKTGNGTGFTFCDLTPESVFNTVKYAVDIFYTRKDDFFRMRQRGMNKNFSWSDSAKKYIELYKKFF